MNDRTCSVDGCQRPVSAKSMCKTHYERARVAAQAPRACAVEGCPKPMRTKGWCTAHYARWLRFGDPTAPYLRQPQSGPCSVEGCEAKARSRGLCAGHGSQLRQRGEAKPFTYKWAERGSPCAVCSGPVPKNSRRRRYCSGACQAYASRARRANRPIITAAVCARCSGVIDLLAPGVRHGSTKTAGRKRRNDSKLCAHCARQRRYRHKWSVQALANRDGIDCGICREPVDMTLRWPDQECPSVDHVLARADGGTDHPSNLQLAHLSCNYRKSRRSYWTVP